MKNFFAGGDGAATRSDCVTVAIQRPAVSAMHSGAWIAVIVDFNGSTADETDTDADVGAGVGANPLSPPPPPPPQADTSKTNRCSSTLIRMKNRIPSSRLDRNVSA